MTIEKQKLTGNEENSELSDKLASELESVAKLKAELELMITNLNSQKEPVAFSIGERQESTGDIVTNVVKAMEQSKTENLGYYKQESIDPKDVLEHPIEFTSYGLMYLVLDDKKNGLPVLPPGCTRPGQRKYLFKPAGRVKRWRMNGDKQEMYYQQFCSITIGSKKEAEWLKNHSRFGIEFFTNTNMALSTNAQQAQIAIGILKSLEHLEADEIVRRAQSLNIPVGGDPTTLKSVVAFTLASQAMGEYNEGQKQKTLQSMQDAILK